MCMLLTKKILPDKMNPKKNELPDVEQDPPKNLKMHKHPCSFHVANDAGETFFETGANQTSMVEDLI